MKLLEVKKHGQFPTWVGFVYLNPKSGQQFTVWQMNTKQLGILKNMIAA